MRLSFQRLEHESIADVATWCQVFEAAPSFTSLTGGRVPSHYDAVKLFYMKPNDRVEEEVFRYAIFDEGRLCGCISFVADHPEPGDLNLILLVLADPWHGSFCGVTCFKWVLDQAVQLKCGRISGVVDRANDRAFRFWHALGMKELYRERRSDFVGEAVTGFIPVPAASASALGLLRAMRRD